MLRGLVKWFKGAGELNSLMAGADALVNEITGVNPKTFHPKLYQHLIGRVMAHNEALQHNDGHTMNKHEGALLMLYLLRAVAQESGNASPVHKLERYESAIEIMRKRHDREISPAVSLICFSI